MNAARDAESGEGRNTNAQPGERPMGSRAACLALVCAAILAIASAHGWAQQRPRSANKPQPVPTLPAEAGSGAAARQQPTETGGVAPVAIDDLQVWLQAAPPPGSRSYLLGTGDVVRLLVFQQPDMAMETRVSDTGTITVPLLGPVQVGGGTAKQAEARIAALLRARGFVRDPQVNVTVMQFKSQQISVLGYVNRPGRYALEEGPYRITDALSLAGGVVPGAADVVTLVRTVDGRAQRYEVDIPHLFKAQGFEGNLEVRAGDSLYVDKAPMFYIYGEVQRPGTFRLEKGMTVMQALSVGGGLNPRGTEKNMRLTRRDANGRQITLTPTMNESVQPDDVLYIRESLF